MPNFKTKKIRSAGHLAFIRQLPCLKCSSSPCDAAHIRSATGGGTGLKPGDEWTVPLCRDCHSAQHRTSEDAFFGDMDKIRQLARNLWLLSGDTYSGIMAIGAARCNL